MPFIDMGKEFGNVKEVPLAPEAEYDLRVTDVEEPPGKSYVQATIEITGTDFKNFNHFVNLPNKEKDDRTDEEKSREPGTTAFNKMIFVKRFLVLFGIPFEKNGFNPKDFLGATARAGLTQSVSQNGMRNNNISLPPLPEEG
ncbi:hypothetical protein LCGC14_2132590 [marine sediment metagenome]|uniref:DUF669 domain-containing protein n=1 Tax=marine sediment metagenome TaxID=412755 RepID=A0A0F9GDX4_9ZZZZ